MINASDFKKGVTIEIDGNVFVIVDFQHVKPGKGAAFVRTKIKNVITGSVLERTFNPTDKMPKALIETKDMQFLYVDGDFYNFMDNENYEQTALTKEQVEEALPYLKDNMDVQIKFFKGKPFSVQPPNFVELRVVETEQGVRGDTATNTLKPAKLETGYTVMVPLFVNMGDTLRIDTRTGEYMERA
jgi:elongation factor P